MEGNLRSLILPALVIAELLLLLIWAMNDPNLSDPMDDEARVKSIYTETGRLVR